MFRTPGEQPKEEEPPAYYAIWPSAYLIEFRKFKTQEQLMSWMTDEKNRNLCQYVFYGHMAKPKVEISYNITLEKK